MMAAGEDLGKDLPLDVAEPPGRAAPSHQRGVIG